GARLLARIDVFGEPEASHKHSLTRLLASGFDEVVQQPLADVLREGTHLDGAAAFGVPVQEIANARRKVVRARHHKGKRRKDRSARRFQGRERQVAFGYLSQGRVQRYGKVGTGA